MEAAFTVVELMGQASAGSKVASSPITQLRELVAAACERGDQVARTLGDSVLLASRDARGALELVRRVQIAIASQGTASSSITVRIGVHYGEAVRRGNEWFGSTINVAGRICGEARRGQVVVSEAVARHATDAGFDCEDLGFFELRGVMSPVQLFALESDAPIAASVLDPVCQTTVKPESAVGRLRHDGTDYYFCSLPCAGAFAADPASFTSH